MADKRISQLNSHTSPSGSDILVIVNNNETKKITYEDLIDGITSDNTAINNFTASYLIDSASFDNRIDTLENWSSSLTDTFATDLEVSIVSSSVAATIGIVSQQTGLVTTSSFNSYTASQSTSSLVSRLNAIENVSSSWITESETGSFLTSLNGAISSSEQVLGSSGVYSSSAQINGNIYSAGSSFTFQDLLLGAGTTFGKITTDGSKYISVMPTYNVESARFWPNGNVTIQDGGDYVDNGFRLDVSGSSRIVGSFNVIGGITGSTNFDTIVDKPTLISGSSQLTSSFDTRYTLSGSISTTPSGTISGSSQLTSSFDTRYTLSGSVQPLPSGLISGSSQVLGGSGIYSSSAQLPSGLISGSSQLTASYDTRYTLSGSVVSGTTPAGTISGSSQLTSSFDGRYTQTGSFNTLTASFNSFTASAQSVTTGSNSFNGNQTITGSLTVSSVALISSSLSTNSSSLFLTTGSNLYVQNNGIVEITGSLIVSGSTNLNVNSLLVGTGSGDEGGEIQLAVPQTNTSLTNKVIVDVFQNRLRLWEGGPDSKGVHIDLSKAPNGNAGELLWKVSGMVAVGTFVTLDNLKCTVTASGSRGLSIGAVSTTFEADISGWYGASGGGTGLSANNQTITTSASPSFFGWNFVAHGDTAQYQIRDKTNNRFYRVTMMIGVSYISNFISIERLF